MSPTEEKYTCLTAVWLCLQGLGDSEELTNPAHAHFGLAGGGQHTLQQLQPGLGRHQLAAMGQQLSAPSMRRGAAY